MSLEQTLKKVIVRLDSGTLDNEAQVKAAVVLPVLRELGWDDADPSAFKPEFAVGRRFVDYALLDHGKPLVFIEAKHVGAKVGTGEDQLFSYASNKGIPLLVLTNGWYWDFYLSMAEGIPADRRFFSVDLHQEENVSEYVDFLEQHLREHRVCSGKARLSAEGLLQHSRNRERARNAIPGAWRALVQERDEMLREVLAERVENECRVKPDVDDVLAFLAGLESPEPKKGSKPRPKRAPIAPSPPSTAPKGRSRIKGFVLDGKRVDAESAIATLVEVLNTFQRRDSGLLDRLAPKTTGRKRRLVARKRSDLHEDTRLLGHSQELEGGWWLYTKHSASAIRRYIETACKEAGIKYGDQLKLIDG